MRQLGSGLLILLLAASALVWTYARVNRGSGRAAGAEPGTSASGVRLSSDSAVTSAGEPSPLAAPIEQKPGSRGIREAIEPPALAGRIVDETGQPVSGATISWAPVPAEMDQPLVDASEIVERVPESQLLTRTSSRGGFAFEDAPSGIATLGSVLWITHPGYAAKLVEIGEERETWPAGSTWRLTPATACRARVEDASGRSVAGALVVQIGAPLSTREPENGRLGWLLRRDSTTDGEGAATLAPMGGRYRLEASEGERAAVPWEGEPREFVVLRLGGRFQLAGALQWSPELAESTTAHVTCWAHVGSRVVELGSVRARGDRYGPKTLPVADATELRVRLHGEGITTQEHRLPPASPGETVFADFVLEPGTTLWFLPETASGELVPGATATVRWTQGEEQVVRVEPAREDGYIPVWGLPRGTVLTTVRAPGYHPTEMVPIEVPLDPPGTIPAEMTPGGVLSGVVLKGGAPVHDFEVLVRPTRGGAEAWRFPFSGVADGRFEIDESFLGEVTVLALAVGRSQSEPQQLTVVPGTITEVRLELPPTRHGRGRVVQASSGSPITNAMVRVPATDAWTPMRASGPSYRASADGFFEVPGVAASGAAVVEVRARGYSTRIVSASAPTRGPVDFGLVELVPRQPLDVRLHFGETTDPRLYALEVEGPDGSLARQFDSEGRARIDSLSAGTHTFVLFHPNASYTSTARTLLAGADWSVDLFATGGASVRIRIVGNPAEHGVREALCFVRNDVGAREVWSEARVDPSGTTVIRNLEPGEYEVGIRETPELGGRVLATRRVSLTSDEELVVELEVGTNERRFRVVDGNGEPLSDVAVGVNLAESRASVSSHDRTDADGVCTVVGLDGAEVFAHLAHPTRGYKLGIPVTLGLPDEIVELVFEEPVTTELVLVRATGPLVEGGGGRVFDRRFTRSISGPVSDDQGRSIWTNLAPGEYAFVFDDPGYWAIQQPITIAAGAAPTTVTLYRLCNLDVEVTRAGVPASDVHVRLKRTDGNTPLARFIEWGQIHSSTGGVTTGGDGRFRLEGVAEGNYEWSIDAPEGPVQAHGVVQVRPEQDCVLRVEL